MKKKPETKGFISDSVVIGMYGYCFEISTEYIKRCCIKDTETSKGLIVRRYYEEVEKAVFLASLLKDGKVREALQNYYMEDPGELEKAPEMEKCLDALEKQFSILSDGQYEEFFANCRKRREGSSDEGMLWDIPFANQAQDFFWNILDLREGRYIGSGNLKYDGRKGTPKIETTGKKIYAGLLDLIWRLDNDPDYKTPEEIAAERILRGVVSPLDL